MKLDDLIAAAKEYRELQKLQSQIKELSNCSLVRKFGYTRRQIMLAVDGVRHESVTAEDYNLIQGCKAERERLTKVKGDKTRAKIAKQYGISNEAVTYGLEYI